MPGTALFEKPRWLRDLLRFLPLKSQFVLSGNIRDLQACEVVPGTVTAQSFNQTLCDALLDAGYAQVLAWDPGWFRRAGGALQPAAVAASRPRRKPAAPGDRARDRGGGAGVPLGLPELRRLNPGQALIEDSQSVLRLC